MRATVVHILAVLLIAIFAVGWPTLAKAGCETCQDCSAGSPAKSSVPCPEMGLVCQAAPACASQAQKASDTIILRDLGDGSQVVFGSNLSIAIKPAYLAPETAPPRA